MKTYLTFGLILFIVFACGTEVKEEPKTTPQAPKASELALLMRDIHANSKDWRASIISGDFETDSLYLFDALTQSTPTKAEVGGPAYEGFAAHYQQKLDSLMGIRDLSAAPEAYNNLVSACIQCHQSYCPGPVRTIEKLYISSK